MRFSSGRDGFRGKLQEAGHLDLFSLSEGAPVHSHALIVQRGLETSARIANMQVASFILKHLPPEGYPAKNCAASGL